MGAVDAQVVEQPDGVVGHVGQQVGHGDVAAADGRLHAGRAAPVEPGRLAHVAVVEPHDLEARVPASAAQKSSGQWIIWLPSPMTSSIVGSSGSPKVS